MAKAAFVEAFFSAFMISPCSPVRLVPGGYRMCGVHWKASPDASGDARMPRIEPTEAGCSLRFSSRVSRARTGLSKLKDIGTGLTGCNGKIGRFLRVTAAGEAGLRSGIIQ